jgi:hypothetical protein
MFGKLGKLSSQISLTYFDTLGQFLTLGDKTDLFLAVFLKKVRVFDSAFSDCRHRSKKCCGNDAKRSQISNLKSETSQTLNCADD